MVVEYSACSSFLPSSEINLACCEKYSSRILSSASTKILENDNFVKGTLVLVGGKSDIGARFHNPTIE
jgi:hypothetical protein